MPLSAGTRLGPYQILAPIGAGGMGEVYKARDTRLDRIIAIKVCAGQFSERFEREARAVAALNHPNIVAIYDVGENYIVSEFVDGSSLRGASFPIRKTIELAAQIADGLAAAHAAGFAHRDLKPENIMVARDGRAKILDFGLARDVRRAQAGTEDVTRTLEGVVMGTVGYMSPEQVRGHEADYRSDIFSFGVVLYEMIAGRRAFVADTAAETMTAILKSDPVELPATVSAGLRDVVRHCLEKDPAHRFQSAKDLAFALHMLGGSGSSAAVAGVEPVKERRSWALGAVGVALLAAGLIAGITLADRPFVDTSPLRFIPVAVDGRASEYPWWAPDGRSFTYGQSEGFGQRLLMVRALDSPVGNPVGHGGIHTVSYAVFSKDRTRLYYTASSDGLRRELWTAALAGGKPEKLFGDLGGFSSLEGFTLTPDGNGLVVFREELGQKLTLWMSSPPGAPLQKVPFPDHGQPASRARLRFSPDGRKILAVFGGRRVEYWLSPWPAQGTVRPLFSSLANGSKECGADWMPDNRYVLLNNSGNPADSNGTLLVGDTLTERLYPVVAGDEGYGPPSVSAQGKVLVSNFDVEEDIVELPLDGSPARELIATGRSESYPDWSPAGDQLVYVTNRGGPEEIWLKSRTGDWQRPLVTPPMLGEGPADFSAPVFSPDGRRVAFRGLGGIWIVPVAGGTPTRVGQGSSPTWSPDGEWLAFIGRGTGGNPQLQKLRLGSAAPPVVLHQTGSIRPMWSPGGKWITVLLPEGLGVISADGKETKVLLRRNLRPFAATGWSRDGKTLYVADRIEGHLTLLGIDPETGKERHLADYGEAPYNFGAQFVLSAGLSPSPDGRSLTAGRRRPHGEIWMIEGIESPRTFWQSLFRR